MAFESNPRREGPLPRHRYLELEYTEAGENLRTLLAHRRRLQWLLALGVGVGVAFVSDLTLTSNRVLAELGFEAGGLWLAALLGLFSFAVTLGLVVHDQRDAQVACALLLRLRHLEASFLSECSSGALSETDWGGQYQEQPPLLGQLLGRLEISRATGAAVLQGTCLGIWAFPVLNSVLQIVGLGLKVSAPLAMLVTLYFVWRYIRELGETDRTLRLKVSRAEARDRVPDPAEEEVV